MKAKAIRQLALEHLNDGKSIVETASILKVTRRTVQNWKKSEPIYGSGNVSRPHSRRLTPEQETDLLNFVATRPGFVYQELVDYALEHFSEVISISTAARLLKRNNYTRKRGTRVNINYRVERGMHFLEEMQAGYTMLTASLDEMSVMLNIAPLYGYALRGQRAVVPQPSRRTVSFMLILCVCLVGVLYWSLRSGTMNAEDFCAVLQRLPNGIALMLDNAPIHHATKCLSEKGLPTVAEIAEAKSISLKYIPAYAPHLNPVEHVFNTVRNLLRRQQAWTEEKLETALSSLFKEKSFSKESMTKLFKSVIFGGPEPGQRLKL